MEIEPSKGGTGQSPFSRPPQPKATPTFSSGFVAPRDAARPGGSALSPLPTTQTRVGDSTLTDEALKTLEGQRRSGGQWF